MLFQFFFGDYQYKKIKPCTFYFDNGVQIYTNPCYQFRDNECIERNSININSN
jgi:hypothetical protein